MADSFSYLHKLPVTTLKVDQSFVREIGLQGKEGTPIVRTIIAMAHSLGIQVVAEGLETVTQRDLLLSMGCEVLHRPTLCIDQALHLPAGEARDDIVAVRADFPDRRPSASFFDQLLPCWRRSVMLKEVSKSNELKHDPNPVTKELRGHALTHGIGIIQRSMSPTRYLIWMRVYQPSLSRKAISPVS